MKSLPVSDFAVVIDTERQLVTHAGNTAECFNQRDWSNNAYQSTAYIVQTLDGRIL